MAVVMTMRWAGVTPAEYDQVREEVGWEREPAAGGHLHVAWFDDYGLAVWDVWDSPAAFQTFAETRLMPVVEKVGLGGVPETDFLPCHYYQKEDNDPAGAVVTDGGFPDVATYDAIANAVDWAGKKPNGGIAHIAAVTPDGGISSIAVWRSASDNEAFLADRVGPAAAALGLPADATPAPAVYNPVKAVFHPAGPSGRM